MRPLVYTQRSVAFPTLPPRDRELDEVNVDGSESSISFSWIDLSSYEGGAIKVEAFSDALATLLDKRIARVLEKIAFPAESMKRDVSPAQLIEWLEEEGAIASVYHLRGLSNGRLSLSEQAALQSRLEIAKREAETA